MAMNREAFQAALQSIGLALSESRLSQFSVFEDALYTVNEHTNLTRVPRDECIYRHFIDSLLIHDMLDHVGEILDIGSGAGFPAWPLAVIRPDIQVTAIDSAGKMTRFLESQPLDNLMVVNMRMEEWRVEEAFDLVTGRAVAPLAIQLELSAAACAMGGRVIPMRTPSDTELTGYEKPLGLELVDVIRRTVPVIGGERVFPIYRKVKKTAEVFPRTWAEIKRRPLTPR